MKIIIFITLFLSITLTSAIAEMNQNVYVTIRLENGKNDPWTKLVFGLGINGTDEMDEEYGEEEIPNFPFPSGIFTAVFITEDASSGEERWAYSCIYGPHKDSISFFKKYRFRVFYGGSNYVTMKWNKLPNYLDSAIISDPYGGNFFRVNMAEVSEKTNYEELVDEFEIYAHYTVDPNSIYFTDFENKYFNIYPNPAKDYIYFNNYESIKKIRIYDIFGKLLINFENYDGEIIDIRNFSTGNYLISIENDKGENFVKKLIICK
ncbi:MAG: hypothetical protein A2X64_07985 [Ignavibacteria bacterium GWF2_33_9]|nr:MAG: hypothetical protein A2X64_07985 [Ignavibacteria bacterium GWF2_33_9]